MPHLAKQSIGILLMIKQWQQLALSITISMIVGSTITGVKSGNRQQLAMMGSGAGIAGLLGVGSVLMLKPGSKRDETLKITSENLEKSTDDLEKLSADHLTLKQTSAKYEEMANEYYRSAENLQIEVRAILEKSGLERSELSNHLNILNVEIERLKGQILSQSEQHQVSLASEQKVIDGLESELESLRKNHSSTFETEVSKRVLEFKRDQLDKIYNDFAPTTDAALLESEKLSELVRSLWNKNEEAQKVAEKFKGDQRNLHAMHDVFQTEKQTWLGEMESLRLKIAELQQSEKGIFHQPILVNKSLDESNMIASLVVNTVFSVCKIPLKVEAWTRLEDGRCSFGLMVSANQEIDSAIAVLNAHSEAIGKIAGSFEAPKFKRSDVFNGVICAVQFRKKQMKADLSTMLRSPQNLLKMLRDSRPFVRLIAAPQGGKTPMINLIVAEILRDGFASDTGSKVALTTVSYCDPLDGVSIKNTENLKFVDHHSSYDEAFKALAEERDFRTQKGNSDYTSETAYLWICDEFDEAISQDESRAKIIRSVSKNGTHMNIGVISASQTDQIGMLKMNTSDLKMWKTLLLDEESIRSFLENYSTKTIGGEKTIKLLANLEAILLENKGLNETIADTARHFRFCLVIDGKYSAFYQLPYFDSAEFNVNTYIESRTQIATIRATNSHKTDVEAPQATAETYTQQEPQKATFSFSPSTATKPHCPNCQSDNLKSNGANRYLCKDCGKSHAKSKSVMS